MRRAVVIGGGVAGIAASIRLAEAGWKPILLETRGKLGGRATSFDDPRSGRVLDNCQHVVMGCCSNILDLYQRLGVADRIEWHPETWWANPPRRPDRLRPAPLPAPGQFSLAFLRMRLLSTDAKILIGQAMLRLIRIGFAGRMEWADRPFGDFLTETGQSDDARRLFWDPVVISACNLPCDQVAGNHAMQVFQESFLSGGWQATMGLATCDLRSLYDPAISAVETAGGMVRLGNSVRGIAFDGIRANGVVTDEGLISAAAIISTVPPDRLAKLVSRPMLAADPRLANLHRFEHSPILGVHLFFESPVLVDDTRTYPHLVLPGRATHWFFNKGQDESGLHHVHAVISAADDWMDLDESAIAARVLKDLHWALPGSRGLMPIEVRSVKEKRATFRASPGIDSIRPSARPGGFGVPNLFLAGDWCDTGWPATMEGAARSGYAAAAAVTGVGGVIRDVPAGPLARWMGLR